MPLPSYSDVFNITHERLHDEAIAPGDVVRMGDNLQPHFTVIAVQADKAWVRDLERGGDHIASLSRCRKLPEPTGGAA